jgi:hypothetical protein
MAMKPGARSTAAWLKSEWEKAQAQSGRQAAAISSMESIGERLPVTFVVSGTAVVLTGLCSSCRGGSHLRSD